MKANRAFLILTLLILGWRLKGQEVVSVIQKSPFSIGETLKFKSEILEEERQVNVFLPAGYEANIEKKYPVIYLFDGGVDQDFIHVAGLVQYSALPWINTMPESIVVGIVNTDRNKDYTFPSNNADEKIRFPTSGHSENFIKFISSELQPLVERSYRVRNEKTIIGQSHGGLLATEILLKHPQLFDNYIIVSPSLSWSDGALLKVIPQLYSEQKKIYFAIGNEGPLMEKMMDILYRNVWGVRKSDDGLSMYFFEDQIHSDVLHVALYDAFEKIFADW